MERSRSGERPYSRPCCRVASLFVDGRELRPVAWNGSGPGGHRREGVLKFSVGEAATGAVELRILRSGEAATRTFRWDALTQR